MRTIVIIGAGFCGAMTAANLLRHPGSTDTRLILLNPSPEFGRGVAYGTRYPEHRLNVPAGNMSSFEDDPGHFVKHCQRMDENVGPGSFVSRSTYGEYLEAVLMESEALGGSRVQLERIVGEAIDVRESPDGMHQCVVLANGARIPASAVVLAFGHPAPVLPGLESSSGCASARFIADPWVPGAIDRIEDSAPVMLVGTGLTAVNIRLSLAKRCASRSIVAVSRHGLHPISHREHHVARDLSALPKILLEQPASVREYMRCAIRLARSGPVHRNCGRACR